MFKLTLIRFPILLQQWSGVKEGEQCELQTKLGLSLEEKRRRVAFV